MNVFFDSSVVIAALSEDDESHLECLEAWKKARQPLLYAHGLLECFATLTGRRHPAHLRPDEAILVISRNMESAGARLIELTPRDILAHLQKAHQAGVRGGSAYDYMHLCAARKASADRILTLNKRHFVAIAPDLAHMIAHPADII